MSAARLLPTWQRMARCSESACGQDAAFGRPDGRCYLHGKIADGLMQKLQLNPGRPATGSRDRSKGRAHHKKY
jgi:hypothetical protein